MKSAITVFIVLFSTAAQAQNPIYSFSLDDTDHARFVGERGVAIFPVSDRAKPMLDKKRGRDVRGVGYLSGIVVKTENPKMAAQEIFNQLSEKTGEQIGRSFDSVTSKANPAQILMGFSKSSVWNLVLAPRPDGNYILTVSYLIEK